MTGPGLLRVDDTTVVVTPSGELDVMAASSLRATLRAALETGLQVVVDLSAINCQAGGWAALRPMLDQAFHEPFDLKRGPALRARLFTLAAQEHVLLLTVHHGLADFWSLLVMVDELGTLYRAHAAGSPLTLPPPAHAYADFVSWQEGWLAGETGERLWS